MSDTPHDNDADGRPRIYKSVTTKHGKVETTVKGGEGETSSDIAEEAVRQFEHAIDEHESVRKRDENVDTKGVN